MRSLKNKILFKTLTWRGLIIVSNIIVSYAVTRNINFAASIGGVSAIVNTVLYFVHEKLWETKNGKS